ncbi:MAG: 2-oxoacid:acceptor oxidoreductase family protein, partial [Veillonellaceae bacterium]|nr:2-oxoacid:acceptor oxidoreductase family protein [Veillonellaceae bacterium]
AVMEGKYAVQSQSYGPEARGGASKAEVIISDEPVWHPHVEVPDVVLAMTQKAADKYYKDINPDGVLVLDEQLVPEPPDFSNVIRIPITKYAIEKLGKPLFANIIALGALVKVTGLVDIDDVKTCVSRRVPPHTVEKNMQALDIGYGSVK